mgnify:CR=1 FL=1
MKPRKNLILKQTDLWSKMASRIVVVCEQYLGSQNSHKCWQMSRIIMAGLFTGSCVHI